MVGSMIFRERKVQGQQLAEAQRSRLLSHFPGIRAVRESNGLDLFPGYLFKILPGTDHFLFCVIQRYPCQVIMIIAMTADGGQGESDSVLISRAVICNQ